jgi:hypothetical protein
LTADPLRSEFARRLRGTGLVVHEAYGSAGQPIDLAVEDPEHPGHVLVAVETDGPTYAAMRSSRDRDRLRGEQLGRLGWMHVRVWTTDLFRDPARDVARVNAAVQQAVANRAAAAPVVQTPVDGDEVPPAPEQETPAEADESSPSPVPETPTDADEFTPTSDGGARARRVRGRKSRRVTAPAKTEQGELELGELDPEPADSEPAEPEPAELGPVQPQPADGEPAEPPPSKHGSMKLEQTKDDTDAGWGEHHPESAYDRYLREQRPPHWGSD